MNKSLFKKLFIPIALIGVIVILIVSLVATPEDVLNSFILGLIIWIPVWAVISLAITVVDEKKKLGLESKITSFTNKVKTKPKITPKTKKESPSSAETKDVTNATENDPFDVKIEEVELGVYNIDFGDVVSPVVKVDKAISSVVAFENTNLKNEFKAFCDNGFKPVEKSVKTEIDNSKIEPVIIKKPTYDIKKPEGAPSPSVTPEIHPPAPISKQEDIPVVEVPEIKKEDVKLNSEIPLQPANKNKEVKKEDIKLNSEIPLQPANKNKDVKKELPELVFIPEDAAELTPKPIQKLEVSESKPQQSAKQNSIKKTSPFKIPVLKFNARSKTMEKNEEAIFNPVAMKPKELDIPQKPNKLIITDERLVNIVKYPETMTPAELNLIKSNQDLKKRYYEFMSALFDEDD